MIRRDASHSLRSSSSFAELRVEELAGRCREEESARSNVSKFASACFELFRRAILDDCQTAWRVIYHQYKRQMIHWAGGRSADAEDVVHRGLEKFITKMRERPDTFTGFAGLASVMAYLKRCIRSVRVDRERKTERKRRIVEALEITSPAHARSSEQLVLDPLVRERCAEHIRSRLNDEQERLLVHLQFELDLKPAEIVDRRPDQFPDADEVYKVRERVIRRLSRDLALEDLWTDRVGKRA